MDDVDDDGFNKTYLNQIIECNQINVITIVLCIIFCSSLWLNALLLRKLYTNKLRQTNVNKLIIVLTLFNLTGTILEFPLVIINSYYCK